MSSPDDPIPSNVAATAQRGRPVAPYVVLAMSLLATAGAALYVGAQSSANDRTHFENLAERTQTSIVSRLDTYINLLRGGTGLFAASSRITAFQFRTYVTQLDLRDRFPGVQGIGLSLRIPAAQRDTILSELRKQPELKNLNIQPATPPRSEYHAITYLEPLDERNQRAIGFDMFTEPTRRAAMERARDTADAALSGKVRLITEDADGTAQPGFLVYVPVYYAGPPPLGIDDRRLRLAGFVYSPFRANDLFRGLLETRTPHRLAFNVYDGESTAPEALLYRSDAEQPSSADDEPRFVKRAQVYVAGRPWTILFRTRPEFESSSSRGFTLLVVGLGVIVSILLFTISYGQATARLRAERAADELRESELALRASESKFRRLADSNLVGVGFADTSGCLADANDALLAIIGRSRDELRSGGLRWDAITPPEFRDADAKAVEQLRATGVCAPYEKQYVRPDGTRVPVLVGIALLEGDTGEAVGIVMDLTERNRAVDALKAARDAANAARTEAEGANRLKDEFLATVSHELRTPLNAILGWAQILREGAADPEEVTQGLATIERNAKAQAQLVEDLLDVSRIVSGKLRLHVQPVELPDVIDAAIEAVRPAAEAKGVSIHRVLDRSAGRVSGDPDRLQQVVWNLVSNGVKFTPRGGSVQVLLQSSGGNAEIAVSDTGRGISREFLPYVFERFRQATGPSASWNRGLGLGLSIVREIVQKHGGTVVAESDGEGKGATFRVQLPLRASAEPVAVFESERPRTFEPRVSARPH